MALALLAVGLSACSQEVEYTPEQRSCIAQHYSAYDAKQINQCVDVCRLCMKGNIVTCNTSCRLRGRELSRSGLLVNTVQKRPKGRLRRGLTRY